MKEPIVKTFSGLRFWVDNKVVVDDPKRVMEYMLDVYENYEVGNKTHEAIAETLWDVVWAENPGGDRFRESFMSSAGNGDSGWVSGFTGTREEYYRDLCICHETLEDILNDTGADWMEELA